MEEEYTLPSYKEWAVFLRSHFPPPGTKCKIVAVKGSRIIMVIISGKFKGKYLMSEFFYDEEDYAAIPRPLPRK